MPPSSTLAEHPRAGWRALAAAVGMAAAGLAAAPALADEPVKASPPPPATTAPAADAAPAGAPAASSASSVPASTVKPPAVGPRTRRAHAQETPPTAFNPRANKVRWDDGWPRFRTAEYIVTAVAGVSVFAAGMIPPEENRWREMGDFDATARDVLRLRSANDRKTASDASDLLLTLMVNQLVVDAALVAWWGHDRPSVAYQLAFMDAEALAVTGGVQSIVSGFASRWRPYRGTCVGPIDAQTRDCRDYKQYRSFFSGHTSGAFTVAGLMCMHHAYLPLYGGGVREKLTCAASFAAAATVGMLRMVSDQHFLSDALVGAAIGTLSGLGIPWLFHYSGGAAPVVAGGSSRGSAFSFQVAPTPAGLMASGEF